MRLVLHLAEVDDGPAALGKERDLFQWRPEGVNRLPDKVPFMAVLAD